MKKVKFKTKKIQVNGLNLVALNWAVAVCQGYDVSVLTSNEMAQKAMQGEPEDQHAEIRAYYKDVGPKVCTVNSFGDKYECSASLMTNTGHSKFEFSEVWCQGGPIMSKEGIATRKHSESGLWYAMSLKDIGDSASPSWAEFTYKDAVSYGRLSYQVNPRRQRFCGETQLEAAMKCYVASQRGEEIEIPVELLEL